jgi:hypothetical protein
MKGCEYMLIIFILTILFSYFAAPGTAEDIFFAAGPVIRELDIMARNYWFYKKPQLFNKKLF